jgi:hypothetical protein
MDGLIDERAAQLSQRLAPLDEVLAVIASYRRACAGRNMRHLH